MKKSFCNLIKIILSCIFIAILIITTLEIFKLDLFSQFIDIKIAKIHDFYLIYLTIVSIVITAAIAYIAWTQLGGIKKVANADFLLRIDDRYSSDQIIKARVIIHRLYRKTKPKCSHGEYMCNSCNELHLQSIRDKIKKIGKKTKSAEDFIYLRNYLDFLETVGYFAHQDYISPKQVDELLGGMVEYHYEVFKDWIVYRRNRDKRLDCYCELTWLVEKIRADKITAK